MIRTIVKALAVGLGFTVPIAVLLGMGMHAEVVRIYTPADAA